MKNLLKQTQRGFTLVELVVVVAVTGVLAAVAIPKLTTSAGDARVAALAGVATSLTAAGTVNYSIRKSSDSKGVAITGCSDASSALQGGLPSGYTVTAVNASGNDTTANTAASNLTTASPPVGSAASLGCVITTTVTPALATSFTAYVIS
jgi:MSHA pilin protein MshA